MKKKVHNPKWYLLAEQTYKLAKQCEGAEKENLMDLVKDLILKSMEEPDPPDSELPEGTKICY